MKKMTTIERCTAASWLLLLASCVFAVIVAEIMQNLFMVMYSEVKHPAITEIFLLATKWGLISPLVVGVPAYLLWRRDRLEATGPFVITVMHMVSVAVMAVVALGMLWPLLTTTFKMNSN